MQFQNTLSHQRAIQASFRSWTDNLQWRRPFAVTLTMKQNLIVEDGTKRVAVRLDRTIAQDNLGRFLNFLNRKALGHIAQRHGKRIPVIPILDGGNGKHLHYHLIIDCPLKGVPEGVYETLIRLAWYKTLWADHEIDIQPDCDDGWLNYSTKLSGKPDIADSIDWTNLTLPSVNSPFVDYRWA